MGSGSYYKRVYTHVYQTSLGCDSTVTGHVTIGTGGHIDTTVVACGPFTWNRNNQTYNTSGDYTVTVPNGACTDTFTLHLTIDAINLVTNNPSTVCSPNTVDLTAANITVGSDNGLNYTYWTDNAATIPLANPNVVAVSGVLSKLLLLEVAL
jgi:hypothetical protein